MMVKVRTEFVKLERGEEITATTLSFMWETFPGQYEIEKNMMIINS